MNKTRLILAGSIIGALALGVAIKLNGDRKFNALIESRSERESEAIVAAVMFHIQEMDGERTFHAHEDGQRVTSTGHYELEAQSAADFLALHPNCCELITRNFGDGLRLTNHELHDPKLLGVVSIEASYIRKTQNAEQNFGLRHFYSVQDDLTVEFYSD